jgi:hypothetical protein
MAIYVYEVEIKAFYNDPQSGERKRGWVRLSAEKARLREDDWKRCVECHARVKVMKAGPDGVPAAHPEHMQEFPGCSLSYTFDGTKRPNPDAID